jgi:DNA adenine methylase
MKYMGSKNRHAKELLPIILKDRKPGQWYVEPFAGGMNMIDKVDGNRIASDTHKSLIALFSGVVNGHELPDIITEEEYRAARFLSDYSPLKGFIGFGCSYSGKWFGGYARGNDNAGTPRNYALESKNNILKQRDKLLGVKFFDLPYNDLEIPRDSIIYCDPPYEGTTSYKDKFNHEKFWEWCRGMSFQGHSIFISEYNAPGDFKCVWQKVVNNTLVQNTGSKQGVEKLFVYAN